jgi:hypothetical protein
MKKIPVSVNFVTSASIHDALRETAEAEERSVSNLIRKIISDWYAERGQTLTPRQQRSKRSQVAA